MNPFKHCFISLLLVISLPVFAQGEPGDDPDAPIDGGLALLIAGGIGYGIRKAHHMKRRNNMDSDSNV